MWITTVPLSPPRFCWNPNRKVKEMNIDMRWNHMLRKKLFSSDKLQQDFVFHFHKKFKTNKQTHKQTHHWPFGVFLGFVQDGSDHNDMQRMRRIRPMVLPEVVAQPEEHIWLLRSCDGLAAQGAWATLCKQCSVTVVSINTESHDTSFIVSLALIFLALNLQFAIFI